MNESNIKQAIDHIIDDKIRRKIAPALCTINEVTQNVGCSYADAISLMRQLHLSGKYIAHINVNKVPMLERL
jgi:hypothetical protein